MHVIPELSASHMEDDKKPGKNYTAYEKELLLEILKRYPIIEDKGNDNSINNKKQEAWDRVTTEYNSHENVAKRDKANLKSLWKNLKIKAKKDHARHKKEMLKTGVVDQRNQWTKCQKGSLTYYQISSRLSKMNSMSITSLKKEASLLLLVFSF
ncbi:myb/sant-like DNA-binding domain-containing protein 3 [Plakobranchus ocellatus]|uniref:Myb/sant-like DNA-binding domain-containing protein 3 n=1 Tax=Plakobranchus ocellatus TaxID=259542 RepID=A0AAV4BYX0_9GAST|nr:myb/sant-like DNA-binding domain-containing protein 3 [Plakobranchus ocellatus]